MARFEFYLGDIADDHNEKKRHHFRRYCGQIQYRQSVSGRWVSEWTDDSEYLAKYLATQNNDE